MSNINGGVPSSGPGSGTVTSITFNGGLTSTPDPVVATGTATLDQSSLTTTDGTVYWTGSKLATTTTGTSGQLLTSNGVGVAPTYQNAAASSITITGDSGGGLTGNSFTFTGGSTGLTFAGAGSTETVGGTLVVSNGGTGRASSTAYAVLCGGTTSTGAQQSIASVGTSGQVLTSNGAGALPTFQAASGGITTLNGDSGSATGATVTFNAASQAGATVKFSGSGATMSLNTTDVPHLNTFVGNSCGVASLTSLANTAFGYNTLNSITNTDAGGNTAIGRAVMTAYQGNATGGANCALGQLSLFNFLGTTGGSGQNMAFGPNSLDNLLNGAYNVAVGYNAGGNLSASESHNIYFNTPGTASESNTCRIGNGTGTGTQQLNTTFISGIFGKTVGVSGVPVVVANNDQLGTVVSSRRFKENIEDLNESKVLELQPVSFNYIQSGDKSVGLIAEDVAEVMPELVVYDKDALPLTVKYQDLSIYLLSEVKKLRKEVDRLKRR